MTSERPPVFASPFADQLQAMRGKWGWFLVLGICQIILGICAMSSAFVATMATVVIIGTLLLVAGAFAIVTAFWSRSWGGFFIQLLWGILYLILGGLMIERPGGAAAAFTLMIAACFIAGGLLRTIASIANRFPGWGWMLLNGVITIALGIMIWRGFPESSLWVIGLFVGIELFFHGWSWIMLALTVRTIPAAGGTV